MDESDDDDDLDDEDEPNDVKLGDDDDDDEVETEKNQLELTKSTDTPAEHQLNETNNGDNSKMDESVNEEEGPKSNNEPINTDTVESEEKIEN